MSDSVKEQIMKQIVSTIKTITKKAGYQFDIEDDAVIRGGSAEDVDLYPSVYLYTGDEAVADREQSSSPTLHQDLIVNLEMWASDADELDTVVNNLEADIIKALFVDTTRNGLAQMTEVLSSTATFYGDGQNSGARILTINVRYLVRERNPYSQ